MRVTGGFKSHRRHKKILQAVKGYRLTRSKLYRVAKQAYLHAGSYAFAGRRLRRRDMRRLWIQRLNATLRQHGLTYSRFIPMLTKAGVTLNRKSLAQLGTHDSETFNKVLEVVNK